MEAYEAREAGGALLRLEVHGQTTAVVSAAGEEAPRKSRFVVGFLLAGMALSACGGESSDALIERQAQPLETPTEEVPEGECAEAEEFFPDPQQPKIPLGSILDGATAIRTPGCCAP
ncbi:hypothetical protein WME91_45420 [Sorangium sp. So ce269]